MAGSTTCTNESRVGDSAGLVSGAVSAPDTCIVTCPPAWWATGTFVCTRPFTVIVTGAGLFAPAAAPPGDAFAARSKIRWTAI